MPQVSLYIDRILYMEIKSIAEKKKVPLSRHVCDVLKKDVKNSWPEGFFEAFFGAMKDDPLEEPEEWEYI